MQFITENRARLSQILSWKSYEEYDYIVSFENDRVVVGDGTTKVNTFSYDDFFDFSGWTFENVINFWSILPEDQKRKVLLSKKMIHSWARARLFARELKKHWIFVQEKGEKFYIDIPSK